MGELQNGQIVFIVEGDPKARQSLTSLVRSLKFESEAFPSAREFLSQFDPMQPGCLILQLRMPGLIGLDWLETINNIHAYLPAIVVSEQGDVATVVRAMRAGAFNFLQKPFRDRLLWDAVQEAFTWNAAKRRQLEPLMRIRRRLESLSLGEFAVLQRLLEGKSNKAVAADLNLSVRAVEVRRAKLMSKMKAHSLAELVRMKIATDASRLSSRKNTDFPRSL
jgi:two-component system response regulator FixJ